MSYIIGERNLTTNEASLPMSLLSSLEDTYCTYSDKDTNHSIIRSFSKMAGVDLMPSSQSNNGEESSGEISDDLNEEPPELQPNQSNIHTSKRSDTALNTLRDFENILAASNPDTFMFGFAYNRACDLTSKQIQHLLDQYTMNAASNTTLLFHLFNVRQRHQNINGVFTTLKGDKKSMSEFVHLVENSDFKKQLKNAAEDPQGNDAKVVISKVLPLLRAAGRKTTFGSMERRSGVSHMIAMTRRYGPASTFVTIAPDDINSITGFRLTFRSVDNNTFPSVMTDEDLKTIREGADIIGEGEVKLPTAYLSRARAVINNPHSSSKEYKRLIEQVFGILVNIPVSYKMRKSTDYRSRGAGIFGEILGFYGVTETQARGALHLHAILYGGLSPYLLQQASHITEICNAISEVLNDIFSAELGAEDHAHDLLIKGLRACNNGLKESDYSCPPALLQHTDEASISTIRDKTCRYAGVHTHSFTCYSGTHGHCGCRLGYKCALSGKTGPVQLYSIDDDNVDVNENDRVSGDLRISNLIEVPQHSRIDREDPLRYDETRIITWEIQRKPTPPRRGLLRDVDFDTKAKCIKYLMDTVGKDLWLVEDELSTCVHNATHENLRSICNNIHDALPDRNGYVVCHNKILSSLMRCNTAVYSMTSLEASIAITMYLTTYFTKKKAPIQQMLSTLFHARRHIEVHKSTADDTGTTKRTLMHFLQRVLNSMDVTQEISDTQVAFSLCGGKAYFTSDIFSYLDIWTSIQWVIHEQQLHNYHAPTYESENNDTDKDLEQQDVDDETYSTECSDDGNSQCSMNDIEDETNNENIYFDDDVELFNEQSGASGTYSRFTINYSLYMFSDSLSADLIQCFITLMSCCIDLPMLLG